MHGDLADHRLHHTALTEYEYDGLSAKFGLADGHAYHDLDTSQMLIVSRLSSIWRTASLSRQRDVEREFSGTFYSLAGQRSVVESDNFRICTSASQSIDLACAWLARARKKIALVEPTFDNLALIIRRWNIPLSPIAEDALFSGSELSRHTRDVDAIFLVNPNNPTGSFLTRPAFEEIVEWCVRENKILVSDFCFRFFSRSFEDYYQILERSGVSYVAIEDTGKTWPTMDMKASIIAYSASLKAEIEEVFHEIFLGVSAFSIAVLTEFVKNTQEAGFDATLWPLVAEHRRQFREAIGGSFLSIDPTAEKSSLGLEWVRIDDPEFDDMTLTAFLKQAGIACLPGRFFHWSMRNAAGQRNLRFSLLKPGRTIAQGFAQLSRALESARG